MTRLRTLLALAAAAALVWGVVVVTSPDEDAAPDPAARPARLLEPDGPITTVDVVDVATGRTAAAGGAQLKSLRRDLAPLLAIRSFATVRAEYELDQPSARISARTAAGPLPAVFVGATNFDRTGYYARIEGQPGAGLVLMSIGDAARAVLGSTP